MFLVAASVIISSAEAAIISFTSSHIQELKHKKSFINNIILSQLEHKKGLLSNIIISSSLINLLIVMVSIHLMYFFSFQHFHLLPPFLIYLATISIILLLFGEIIPNIIGTSYPIIVVKITILPLYFANSIFKPIHILFAKSTTLFENRLARRQISIYEIHDAIEMTNEGITDEKELLEGIIKLQTTDVKKILKSRVDVVAVNIRLSFESLHQIIVENAYSRMPVYDSSFDEIKGILFVKDLIPYLDKPAFKWQTLIRPAYYIPQSKKIDDLLEEFQQRKVHMAIVIDEYGGNLGIVTLEDILEEIVGEISDEFDDDAPDFTRLDEHSFMFEGKVMLNDFYKITDIEDGYFDEVKGNSETLAGLVLEMKGEFPLIHEELSYKNISFIVESVDKRRINKLRITIKDE